MINKRKTAKFNFVIEKLQTRLSTRKNIFLNKSDRLVSKKFQLQLITCNCFGFTREPSTILLEISFGKATSNHGLHLVGWDKIILPKHKGGLNVKCALG